MIFYPLSDHLMGCCPMETMLHSIVLMSNSPWSIGNPYFIYYNMSTGGFTSCWCRHSTNTTGVTRYWKAESVHTNLNGRMLPASTFTSESQIFPCQNTNILCPYHKLLRLDDIYFWLDLTTILPFYFLLQKSTTGFNTAILRTILINTYLGLVCNNKILNGEMYKHGELYPS